MTIQEQVEVIREAKFTIRQMDFVIQRQIKDLAAIEYLLHDPTPERIKEAIEIAKKRYQ